MSDTDSPRSRVNEPRHDGVDEWEVFLRTDPTEPLSHVGSVTALTAETAHAHAGALFEDAESIWLCPTDEVARFTARTLGESEATNETRERRETAHERAGDVDPTEATQ